MAERIDSWPVPIHHWFDATGRWSTLTDNANIVLARIRGLLTEAGADGRLPTERDLCERLGVGRRAVRMALEVLEEEGLIWRRQGKGTFIGAAPDASAVLAAGIMDKTDALSIMEGRLCIEPALAALAAKRARSEDIERMQRLLDHIGTAPEADTLEIWDAALHRTIARAAGNPVLMTAFALIDELRNRDDWLAMRQRARSTDTLKVYDRQHRAIVDAIADRRPEAARQAMVAHLTRLADNLSQSWMAHSP
jgi:GntR family transcriptional repressor for pyruvate dehydrogenase complex